MKTLTNSGDFTGSRIRISNSKRIPQFSLWKSRQPIICLGFWKIIFFFFNFSPSSPAYGRVYRITDGFLNAATSILKRVSVRIFKISKCFLRSKQKLEFPFLHNKAPKKIKNHRCIRYLYIKFLLIWLLGPLNKLFISWHNPFEGKPLLNSSTGFGRGAPGVSNLTCAVPADMDLTQGSGMRGRTFDPSPPALSGRLTALGEFSYRASPTGTVHENTFLLKEKSLRHLDFLCRIS